MSTLENLQKELNEIKSRNQRVEADKSWETSWSRKIIVLVLTYLVIVIFFFAAKLAEPFVNAAIPAIAFILSSSSLPLFKKLWVKIKKHPRG